MGVCACDRVIRLHLYLHEPPFHFYAGQNENVHTSDVSQILLPQKNNFAVEWTPAIFQYEKLAHHTQFIFRLAKFHLRLQWSWSHYLCEGCVFLSSFQRLTNSERNQTENNLLSYVNEWLILFSQHIFAEFQCSCARNKYECLISQFILSLVLLKNMPFFPGAC